jgi:hypothetical protein
MVAVACAKAPSYQPGNCFSAPNGRDLLGIVNIILELVSSQRMPGLVCYEPIEVPNPANESLSMWDV